MNTGGKGEDDRGSTEKMRGDLKHSERIGLELEEGHIFLYEQRQGGKFGCICRKCVCGVQGCVARAES